MDAADETAEATPTTPRKRDRTNQDRSRRRKTTRRSRAPRSELGEVRIRHIVQCYRDLTWTRALRHQLSGKWGLSYERMQDLVAEALHRVREELTNPEAVSVTVSCALDQVLRDSLALSKKKGIHWQERDAASRKVIAAAKVWADIVGASKQRIAVSFEPPVAMSTDKLRSLYGDAMRVLGAHLQTGATSDVDAVDATLSLPAHESEGEGK